MSDKPSEAVVAMTIEKRLKIQEALNTGLAQAIENGGKGYELKWYYDAKEAIFDECDFVISKSVKDLSELIVDPDSNFWEGEKSDQDGKLIIYPSQDAIEKGIQQFLDEQLAERDKRIKELEARIRELAEVLAPFAKFRNEMDKMGGNYPKTGTLYGLNVTPTSGSEILVEDFTAARAALKGKE